MKLPGTTSRNIILLLCAAILLTQSILQPDTGDEYDRVRAFTRMIEFDFLDWTLDALLVKNIEGSINAPEYMTVQEQRDVVLEYLDLVRWINRQRASINRIYANPDIKDPDLEAAEENETLRTLQGMEQKAKPIAEAVLQYQVSSVVAEMGLALGGQPIPPVLYHSTSLPNALIVSPRDTIRQDANISIEPEMTTEEMEKLENQVEEQLDVSALVVPIGGVGTYPTMVMKTTDLNWLTEVVSHEWIHNYLTLRPAGMLYMASSEMRTINETAANLAGKEIGRAVMLKYYPELAPPPEPEEEPQEEPEGGKATPAPTPTPEDPNVFNYRREMHKTRVRVDELLAQGQIEAAEAYMDERQRFFWENGYLIRKINQAYFAFYGAYNDVPGGGASGSDPVGPAVQQLRKQSKSLADFINTIAWVTSFEELQKRLDSATPAP